MADDEEDRAIDEYKLLFDLWKSENEIKTNKLQVLLATNSILVAALALTGHPMWIAIVGAVFSTIWVFSIGRTVAYQEHWKDLMEEIRKKHSGIDMLTIHSAQIKPPIWGRVPSKYYLLGTPIATAIGWLIVFIIYAI